MVWTVTSQLLAGMATLPPACTKGYQEQSVRKQILRCSAIVNGDSQGRKDLIHWSASYVFRSYLLTLAEDIDALSLVPGVTADVISQYKAHHAALQQRCKQQEAAAAKAQSSAQATAHDEATRQSLFKGLQVSEAPVPEAAPSPQLTEHDRRTLQTNQDLQDYATDEMVGMAATLKGSTLAMEAQLRKRGKLLDDTDDALEHSLTQARTAKTKAKEIHGRQRIGFCKTCMALLLVACVFVAMYMYIRVTYIIGFKQ